MVLRPSSYYAKFIQPTTQPKQTNPQPNPNKTLLRVVLVNISIGQHKKKGPLGGSRSREIGIFKQLLRIHPRHCILCFC